MALVVVVMLASLFAALLLNGCSLLNARIVALEFDASACWKVKDMLHRLTNLNDSTTISASPDAENVLTIANTQHSTTNIIASIGKLITNEAENEIFPVPVCYTLLHPNHPLSSLLVDIILPYWANAFLEKVKIRDNRECGGTFQVTIDLPELFPGPYSCDLV